MSFGTKEIKELRQRTGAGMLDCKKALEENNGDIEAAVEYLRKKGIASSEKKSSRIAAEGLVAMVLDEDNAAGTLVEVNAETDFVAKNKDFSGFVETLAALVHKQKPAEMEDLNSLRIEDKTVSEFLTELIARIGENMNIRRFKHLEVDSGSVFGYLHGNGRIGALVGFKSNAAAADLAELGKDLAMQVASMSPKYISRNDVDANYIDSEKKILLEQALNENRQAEAAGKKPKPENIIEKMVEGRLNKELQEVCLLEQSFIKDSDLTVGALVKNIEKTLGEKIEVVSMVRYEVGEGLEKRVENFAEEVAKQMA
ncbi:MAG TPA: translation elongation factor Ts [Clostridia bacterium]|nr:translation elongation factor Ts [Clostridia bacterium]